MPFTYDMPPGLPRPLVLLQTPLLGELYGAGFTKAPRRMVSFSAWFVYITRQLKLCCLAVLRTPFPPCDQSLSFSGTLLEGRHDYGRPAEDCAGSRR